MRSARFAGDGAGDTENTARLLAELAGVDTTLRAARFRCVAVYLRHAEDPAPLIAEGVWEGAIEEAPRGERGFGYDPVFRVPTHDCTAAELEPPVKNAISHRAIAFRRLARQLEAQP